MNNEKENIFNICYSISKKLNSEERLFLYKLIEKKNDRIKIIENIIKEVRELVERYSWNTYYYKCDSRNKYLKSEIINDLKEILDKEQDNE